LIDQPPTAQSHVLQEYYFTKVSLKGIDGGVKFYLKKKKKKGGLKFCYDIS
jgi:hypothetical protein